MGTRRKAREIALKTAFEIDFSKGLLEEVLERVRRDLQPEDEVLDFAGKILGVCLKNQKEIDAIIAARSSHWKLTRMTGVDRNILRLGVAEILYFPDIPKSVTINEYLEVAKKYGTDESASFVNGILDKIEKT